LLSSISSCFPDIAVKAYWGHEFDLSGSRDVVGRVTILIAYMPFPMWSFGTKPLSLAVSEIFNVECNAIDLTLIYDL